MASQISCSREGGGDGCENLMLSQQTGSSKELGRFFLFFFFFVFVIGLAEGAKSCRRGCNAACASSVFHCQSRKNSTSCTLGRHLYAPIRFFCAYAQRVLHIPLSSFQSCYRQWETYRFHKTYRPYDFADGFTRCVRCRDWCIPV